ncbi:ParB/RepB/Spo0J family partition protein [Tistrella sp.]|mgnify:CR=1 FL=1|uniref:ParB/RepB/Spo0J family partition protein n=1 Tax=Tistrella sp. TaxID=2024861 RepID=UPI0025E3478B|nr:ParB/RepB/Spo0J family partition protein [Tistrella sp.]
MDDIMPTPTTIMDIRLADIDVPADRARDFSEAGAAALAGIIAAQGLQHPIRVRASGARYTLIAGLHRLRALERLEQPTIPAVLSGAVTDDEARLEEVLENLGRNELTALDRCHHLYELKQVYERMYPQAKHGAASPKAQSLRLSSDGEVFGFARSSAEKIGLSARAIQLAVKIWTKLSPRSRLKLAGTHLAEKQTELQKLSEQTATVQDKILALVLGDEHPDIQSVGDALAHLEGGVTPTKVEKDFMRLRDGFLKLPDPTLDRLLLEIEDRVIASLKRRGRI